jgi:hypothetical protein
MILELGQRLSASSEWIRVTAEYSNAVLVAVMPCVSEVVQKLDLPVPQPAIVASCNIVPLRALAVEVGLHGNNGNWYFAFNHGYVNIVQGPHDYYAEQDPGQIPKYYGQVGMTKAEAVELARASIRKLGVALEELFAEQDPKVTGPERIGTNTIPQYRIEWPDPRSGFANTSVHVDAENRTVTRIMLVNRNLEKPPPEVAVTPPSIPGSPIWPPCNPDYAMRLVPIALKAIEDYGKTLLLKLPAPLTTNSVAMLSLADNGGWPHAEIELTNEWRFIYRNSGVNGYYAPDNFFNSDNRPIRIRDFAGKPTLTESEAINLVKKTVERLHYPTNLLQMDFAPQVLRPAATNVSRLFFSWHKENEGKTDLLFKLEAEVDLVGGRVTSLYFDNQALWNHPPPIDVPLTVSKQSPHRTPDTDEKESKPNNAVKPASRPLKFMK